MDARPSSGALSDPRAGACFGQVLEGLVIGGVTVTRRYGCTRRDQYELRATRPFPQALRDALAARGSITGGPVLYVLDVPGAYQLTVAPQAGRAVMVPRLSTEPPFQRAAALDLAALVDGLLPAG